MSNTLEDSMGQFEIAVQTRNFEIDLFWKRSLFFWGFISAAFVAYAGLRKSSPEIGLIMGCLGTVCSLSWTLVNRGSKYWQESWEQRIGDLKEDKRANLFADEKPVILKGHWLSARKYSVSKLVISLSDYVFILWAFLLTSEIFNYFLKPIANNIKRTGLIAFIVFSIAYLICILAYTQKSKDA
jgi:hypothetical protein